MAHPPSGRHAEPGKLENEAAGSPGVPYPWRGHILTPAGEWKRRGVPPSRAVYASD